MFVTIREHVRRMPEALHTQAAKRNMLHALIVIGSVCASFWITYHGPNFVDDKARYEHSTWLMGAYHLIEYPAGKLLANRYYAPLWETVLGIPTEVILAPLKDPYWIRHALTLSLFPLTLYGLFLLLKRSGYSTSLALLSTACIFGLIRLGGQSLFNMKDAPGALAYLFISVYTWVLLQEGMTDRFSVRRLTMLGIASVIPFLIRSPLLTHYVLVLCVMLAIAILDKTHPRSIRQRAALVLIPLISGLLFIIALSPALWTLSPKEWIKPFTLFSNYPHQIDMQMFGLQYKQNALPWWFAFAWIPITAHPIVSGLALLGCISPFFTRRSKKYSFDLSIGRRGVAVSLHKWLWFITGVSWLAILVIHPSLYHEDRQLLFLYPILYLACVLGLESWEAWEKYALTLIVIMLSLFSYIQWGKYAYAYKSPVLTNIGAKYFMGDYWYLCMNDAVKALKGRIPPTMAVQVHFPHLVPAAVQSILKTSLLRKDPTIGSFRFQKSAPRTFPYAWIASNGPAGGMSKALEAVNKGKAAVLWQQSMPPGEPACMIVLMQR